MTQLESSIRALCLAAEAAVAAKPRYIRQKWVECGTTQMFRDYPDYRLAIQFAVDDAFRATDAYQGMERLIKSDPLLAGAERFGYPGRPREIIARMLLESFSVTSGQLAFAVDKALLVLTRLKEYVSASEISYEVTARLLGVTLAIPDFQLSKNIRIVRLTEEEINDRQFFTDSVFWIEANANFLGHNTEIRVTIVRKLSELDVYTPQPDNTSRQLDELLQAVLAAFRLYKTGRIELGPKSTTGSFGFVGIGNTIIDYQAFRFGMAIGEADVDSLQRAFRLITENMRGDRVLECAIERFLIARQRKTVIDQLVDLVIAWESLLLTVNNSAIRSELSYRFSINGANILHACGGCQNRHLGRALMDCAYKVRSLVVHGGSQDDVQKELKKAGFDNSSRLAEEIEEDFRRAAFWLSAIDPINRPYFKVGGWEELLWGPRDPT